MSFPAAPCLSEWHQYSSGFSNWALPFPLSLPHPLYLRHPDDSNGQLASWSPADHSPSHCCQPLWKCLLFLSHHSLKSFLSLPIALGRTENSLTLTLESDSSAAQLLLAPSPSLNNPYLFFRSGEDEGKTLLNDPFLPNLPVHESKSRFSVMFLDHLSQLVIISLLGMLVWLMRVGTKVSLYGFAPETCTPEPGAVPEAQ